ncbi:hypothetical protein CsSME_00003139 [Camellia sinensis var. sinensis]|uniref:Uncharacterized protein n=1 Tax=Camellia sinensis var. sinensis TaxID=542762 RepID=A0A4V3WNI0_CAMSN|nr:transcription factor DIVARICATA-like [Camellia sinensis]THG12577.1 hypothetical protein TEA_028340 [Camellia sinensis var. sinensis]
MEIPHLVDNLDELSWFFISSPPPPMHTEWTFEENKLFENTLAEFDLNSMDLFEKIASRILGKTVDQIKEHYESLVEDVEMIESGFVPLPDYEIIKNDGNGSTLTVQNNFNYQQRRKGGPWTKEEHGNFLIGLARFGKGDWRSISRHCVQTRNPTQVASHAQKYYIRLQKSNVAQQNANSTMALSSRSSKPGDRDTSTSGQSSTGIPFHPYQSS